MKRKAKRGWMASMSVCLLLSLTLASTVAAGVPASIGSLSAPAAPMDDPELLAAGDPFDVAVGGGYAFWTHLAGEFCTTGSSEAWVRRVSLTTLAVTTLRRGCDFSPANVVADDAHVYYADWASDTIQRIPVGGGASSTVVSGSRLILHRSLALDSTHVYFGDNGGIKRVPKGGGTVDTLAAGYDNALLAVDDTHVYWTERSPGGGGFIRRVSKHLAGGVVDTIASGGALDDPWAIAVDDSQVYWTELGSGKARRMPKGGGAISDFVPADPIYMGGDIAVDGTNVYWLDTTGSATGRLRRAPKGGGTVQDLALGLFGPTGLNLTASHVYWGDYGGVWRLLIGAGEVRVDLSLTNMEITQGIQNLDPGTSDVPMVADKTTFVRAFPAVDIADTPNVTARLHGFRGGVELPGSPVTSIAPMVFVSTSGAQRSSLGQTFNFWVPMSWRSGTVEFRAVINPTGAIPENNLVNNSFSKVVTFTSKAPVCTVMVPVRTHAPRASTGAPGFWDIISLAKRLLPTPDIWVYYQSSDVAELQVCWWGPFPYPCFGPYELPSDDWKVIASLVTRDIFSDDPDECDDVNARTHYTGMVHPDTSMGNLLGYGTYDWAASLFFKMVTDPAASGSVPYYTPLGGEVLAHELSHNQDRKHVNCGGPADTDAGYPYPVCQIDNVGANRHWGFDPSSMSIIEPDEARDLMAYGGPGAPQWVSDYTWRAVYNSLSSTAAQSTGADEALTLEDLTQASEILVVTGVLTATTNTAELDYLYRLPQGQIGQRKLGKMGERQQGMLSPDAEYALLLLNDVGSPLASYPFDPPPANPDNPTVQQFLMTVPFVQGAASVAIVREGTHLVDRAVSPNAPSVHVLTPNGGEVVKDELSVKWEATDKDGDPMVYTVQYSPDMGKSWLAVATHVPTTTLTVTDTLGLPGSDSQALIRVIASDGVNTGSDMSDEPFTVRPHAPIAHIDSPDDGDAFAPGTLIILSGGAFDAEDGTLSGEALKWFLGKQPLGVGKEISLGGLTEGDHTVTLRATDSGQMTGEDSITIHVAPTISVSPDFSTVGISETVTLDIRVDGVERLYGAQVELFFDPELVEVVDAYDFLPGVQIEEGEFLIPDATFRNLVDNNNGVIQYTVSLQGDKPGVSGGGVLARVTFHGLKAGLGTVGFTRVILSDPQSGQLSVLPADGMIMVRESTGGVTGRVILERRTSSAEATVCIDGICANTAADGSYTIPDIPPGPYTATASRMSYLRSWREENVPLGLVTLPDVTLLGGDVNQDDAIEQFDAMSLGFAWNSTPMDPHWDERADVTDDGNVNILDMVAVQFNWDAMAPGPWDAALAQHRSASVGRELTRGDLATQVAISPSQATLAGLGETVDLDIRVVDVTDLYGGRVQITFDPTVIQVRDADPRGSAPGVQIRPGDFLDLFNQFVLVNLADNTAGTIDFAVTQLHPAVARSGSGVLATIQFEAAGEGSSAVHLADVRLGDDTRPDPLEIPAGTQDGQVTVGGQGTIYLPVVLKGS